MSPEDVRALPVTVNVPTAGRVFGLGRDVSYLLADRGDFPVPVLRLGRRRVVTRAAIMRAVGIEDVPNNPLASGVSVQVKAGAVDSESAGASVLDAA